MGHGTERTWAAALLVATMILSVLALAPLLRDETSAADASGATASEQGGSLEQRPVAEVMPASCRSNGGVDDSCVREWLLDLTGSEGAGVAMRSMLAAGATDPQVTSGCHSYAHEIGKSAFLEYDTLDEAFSDGDPTCQFGYYHGVLIGAALAAPDEASFAADVPSLCDFFADVPFSLSSCVHGIGHAAVALTGADVSRGAGLCDGLDGDNRGNCVTGAVMEWSTSVVPGAIADGSLTAEDLEGVCESMPGEVQGSCYREISAAWLVSHPADFDYVLATCDKVAGADIASCYYGAGFRAASYAGMDPVAAIKSCSSGDPAWRSQCVGGAAIIVFEQLYRTEPDRADTVCPAAAVEDRAVCNELLDMTKRSYEDLQVEVGQSGYRNDVNTGTAATA